MATTTTGASEKDQAAGAGSTTPLPRAGVAPIRARATRGPAIVRFYRSAVGKKWVMAITGVVLMGFVQPDSHAHAPNEWMDLNNYETGILTIARAWDEIAAMER